LDGEELLESGAYAIDPTYDKVCPNVDKEPFNKLMQLDNVIFRYLCFERSICVSILFLLGALECIATKSATIFFFLINFWHELLLAQSTILLLISKIQVNAGLPHKYLPPLAGLPRIKA
jgi:hypothetical protein